MITKLIFSVACLMLLLLLIISYRIKDIKYNLSVKLFNYLLYIGLVFIITEIFETIIWTNNGDSLIFNIALKIHWSVYYIFFTILYYYVIIPIKRYNYNSLFSLIKTEKKELFMFIGILIFYVVSIFISIPSMTEETFTFLPGLYAYYNIILLAGILIIILINLVINKDYNKRLRRAILFCFNAFATIFIFQLIFSKTTLFSMAIVWCLVILYFNIENPDLKMISETDDMKEIAIKNSKSKIDFLSNISNNIKFPINNIIGFCNYLLFVNDYSNDNVLKNINNIKQSSNNLLNIINNTLDISKIEAGSENIYEINYSLKDIIIDLYSMINPILENSKVKFNINVDENLPNEYCGDRNKIYQILFNFVTNSIKYTEVGKIELNISGERNNNLITLKFKVSDTGIGIKEDNYDKIFQNDSEQSEDNSIKIGLRLNKKYAELMGGRIWFDSHYGVGSNFYFDVPQKIINDSKIGNIMNIINEGNNSINNLIDCSNKKVLIVDDDELSLKVTKRLLSYYKFDIESMNNSYDCLNKIKAGNEYDILFIDHVMKKFDGVELTKALKGMNGYKIPPIVILTANALEGIKDYYIKNGADNYLAKPIDLNELDRLVNLYFKKQ